MPKQPKIHRTKKPKRNRLLLLLVPVLLLFAGFVAIKLKSAGGPLPGDVREVAALFSSEQKPENPDEETQSPDPQPDSRESEQPDAPVSPEISDTDKTSQEPEQEPETEQERLLKAGYHEMYVAPLACSQILTNNWSNAREAVSSPLQAVGFLYEGLADDYATRDIYERYYNPESRVSLIPADRVENLITDRFDLRKEEIRSLSAQYRESSDAYIYFGSHNALPVDSKVVGYSQDGDIITLECEFTLAGRSGASTLRVEKNADGFRYISNTLSR